MRVLFSFQCTPVSVSQPVTMINESTDRTHKAYWELFNISPNRLGIYISQADSGKNVFITDNIFFLSSADNCK